MANIPKKYAEVYQAKLDSILKSVKEVDELVPTAQGKQTLDTLNRIKKEIKKLTK
jgi:hypothetical protein